MDAGDRVMFSIVNKTRRLVKTKHFEDIKNSILGRRYSLSLVFCGNTLSHRLNHTYRGKDKPTNVLSFPITRQTGEIFINLSRTKPFGPAHLFIHGLLHLKGMQHGDRMEAAEEKIFKKFRVQ